MNRFAVVVGVVIAMGCENVDVENGDGTVTISCTSASSTPLHEGDPPGVIATCDDHLPCTVDVQCTPCSVVPEPIRYVKATCTPDDELSPFCFDSATGALTYTGCTHFAQDATPQGQKNACFPVQYPGDVNSELHAGVCNAAGICIENP